MLALKTPFLPIHISHVQYISHSRVLIYAYDHFSDMEPSSVWKIEDKFSHCKMSDDGLMTCFVESYDDASGNSTSQEETGNNWNLTDLEANNVTEEEEAYQKVKSFDH